ncbi:MAG: hypothetical protein H6706_29150 [Myxococcales bacterium]|nr:hypothetical protein [Myxococcales bacterium]
MPTAARLRSLLRGKATRLCLALLLLVELGVARPDWLWRLVPRSGAGIVDVLETRVIARAEAPQIIVMGSSRVRDALSPRDLERALRLPTGAVLNLGLTSGTPFDAVTLYRRNRAKLRTARLLLVGLEDWYLNGAMAPTERDRRFADLSERWSDWDGELRLSLLLGYVWRTYDARDVIRETLQALARRRVRDVPLAPDGRLLWRADEPQTGPVDVDVLAELDGFFRDDRPGLGRRAQLARLIALAQADGLEVRLLRVPWRDAYLDARHTRHPAADARWRAWIDSLTPPPLGAERASAVGLLPTDFVDYGHLAGRGATLFASLIADQLRTSGWPAR